MTHTISTRALARVALAVAAALCGSAVLAAAPTARVNGLTGTWDRAAGANPDPRYTAAAPVPPPPLKPQ